jgi:G3E family GTPase
MRNVAVDILTGFLGSGKTTLLRHVLEHGLRETRVAIVMNEIGEIGLDGTVITGLSAVEKMVELSGGCICCSIDEYRFDIAIQEIVDTVHPHLIVIESTGLADPEPLAYRVKAAGLGLDATITLIDAANVERCLKETEVARTQIEAADFLVINKLDLVDAGTAARVEKRVRRLNDRALVFHTVRGAIDSQILFATGVATYRRGASAGTNGAGVKSAHLERDGLGAFLYRSPLPLRQEAFERVLARLPREIYRAKGIVQFAARDWQCLFNYTCGRTELSWVKLAEGGGRTQAVFIGREIGRYRDAVLSQLAACETDVDEPGIALVPGGSPGMGEGSRG